MRLPAAQLVWDFIKRLGAIIGGASYGARTENDFHASSL